MNNRIYFNNHFIELVPAHLKPSDAEIETYVLDKQGDKSLPELIKKFTMASAPHSFNLITHNVEDVLSELRGYFKYIEAAGGLIEKNGRHLFIFRNGLWDLPKGKLEKGENTGQCAIRECEEECGINALSIVNEIASTYHVYSYKGSFALKRSYWFYMRTAFSGKLKPQLEENITDVQWFKRDEIKSKVMPETYHTIRQVIVNALGL